MYKEWSPALEYTAFTSSKGEHVDFQPKFYLPDLYSVCDYLRQEFPHHENAMENQLTPNSLKSIIKCWWNAFMIFSEFNFLRNGVTSSVRRIYGYVLLIYSM